METIEQRLAGVWRAVFGQELVPGASFLEQGGDSLRAVMLSIEIQKEFEVEVDFVDILNAESASVVAEQLRGKAS